MTCRDVEQILPGYVDNSLSEGERRDVQEHLARCPQCRLALADLERALALARHSDRVTPPAWLKGRVMARVKAEAGPRPGIIRRLFFPWHIKIPLEAFAMVLVAVLAIAVYRATGPERSDLDLSPASAPGTSQELEQAQQPAAPAPGGTAMPGSPVSGKVEGDRTRAALPAQALKEQPGIMQDKMEKGPAQPSIMAEEEMQEAALPEEKDSLGMEAPAPAKQAQEYQAPAAGREQQARALSTADAGTGPPPVRLMVSDMTEAVKALDALLVESGARILERTMQDRKVALALEIKSGRVPAFVERLKAIGEIRGSFPPGGTADGTVVLRMEIVSGI